MSAEIRSRADIISNMTCLSNTVKPSEIDKMLRDNERSAFERYLLSLNKDCVFGNPPSVLDNDLQAFLTTLCCIHSLFLCGTLSSEPDSKIREPDVGKKLSFLDSTFSFQPTQGSKQNVLFHVKNAVSHSRIYMD